MGYQRDLFMRVRLVAFAMLVSAMVFSGPAVAGERYISAFGFSMEVPANWLAVTPAEIRENPQLFGQIADEVPGVDQTVINEIRQAISAGNMEIYYDLGAEVEVFADNISVTTSVGQVPRGGEELQEVCGEIQLVYRQYFEPPLHVYECRAAGVDGRSAVFVEAESPMQGARSLQYMFPKSESIMVALTGTFKEDRLEAQRRVFDGIVQSIRLE